MDEKLILDERHSNLLRAIMANPVSAGAFSGQVANVSMELAQRQGRTIATNSDVDTAATFVLGVRLRLQEHQLKK